MKTRKNRGIGVYWINLDRSKERRENMLKVLKDPIFDGMVKHRVKGYDGTKQYDIEKMKKLIDMTYPSVTVKEYACFLSHLKAILTFSKSNYEYALILEDDVTLDYKPYWKITIQDCIRNAPEDWEILQLCFFGDTLPKELYSPKHRHSAAAYIIRKKAAQQLMKKMQPLFTLYEKLKPITDYYLFKVLKTYIYRYPFFTFENKDSTLYEKKVLIGRKQSKQNLEKLLNIT
jgi:glycosyl transferase family 25